MKYLMFVLCMVVFTSIHAQQNYDVSLIPKELLPYASAVVRNMETTTEVKDLNTTVHRVKVAVTIFNKNGDDNAQIAVWYDKGRQIKYIRGMVYDERGKPISKIAERDFRDASAGGDESMFVSTRVKHFQPAVTEYPYTLEYEYELRSRQSLIEDWRPNPSAGTAVEQSTYKLVCKPDFNIKFKEVNYPGKVSVSTDKDGLKTYTWQLKNLKAIKDEPFSPLPQQYLTTVMAAPEQFSYEGYKGTFTDWNGLGKWMYNELIKSRGELPPEAITRVKELTAGITDPKLKAKKLYEYMQQKTRYISIQVGIGGLQPMLASDVDRLSYGDCKGLVNYTQALLKAAAIESWYCVVEGGDEKVSLMPDFASINQGNHIILCVPFKNDTTWLECTNQKAPFGFLGDFTDDRYVLACLPDGGKLLHTPKYTAQQNKKLRKGTFAISSTGELSGTINTNYQGTLYDSRQYLLGESYAEQKKILQHVYPMSNMDIGKFDLKEDKSAMPTSTETLTITARDYATESSGRLYFSINSINRIDQVPKEVRNRTTDVYINRGFTTDDEFVYTLPEGYKTDKLPLSVQIDEPFGKFSATMTLVGNQLTYKRSMQMMDGTYSKETYERLVDFYQKILDADHYNVALVKK